MTGASSKASKHAKKMPETLRCIDPDKEYYFPEREFTELITSTTALTLMCLNCVGMPCMVGLNIAL
jgi:hypothetical protein